MGIEYMKTFQKSILYFLILLFIIIFYLISRFSFKNGKPTCSNYVLNVYLYLSLSIIILGLLCYFINKLLNFLNVNILNNNIIFFYLLGIILFFVFGIWLSFRKLYSKEGHALNHILWLLFLVGTSIMLFPLFIQENSAPYIDDALLSTSLIFLFMSIIVYMFPSFFEKTYNYMIVGLVVGLIAIIVIEVINLILNFGSEKYHTFRKYLAYAIIVLFSLFVSYDTVNVFKQARQCVNYPNYPKSSLDFLLDILNLFSNILYLYQR